MSEGTFLHYFFLKYIIILIIYLMVLVTPTCRLESFVMVIEKTLQKIQSDSKL